MTFKVTATDAAGTSTSATYTLSINPAIGFSPRSLPDGVIDTTYSQTITTSGGTGSKNVTWKVTAGAFPSGLNLNSSNGDPATLRISGKPMAAGTVSFDVTASDAAGAPTVASYSLVVDQNTPFITSVTPATGPATGGTRVTIEGGNLDGATLVDFGAKAASIVSDTATEIVVISPDGLAGLVDLTVTTANGKSPISAPADHYTYEPLPKSAVTALPVRTASATFTVSWSGSDPGGPGVGNFSVYVSDNGGAFQPFVTNSTQTSAAFSGNYGHLYAFYSVATDVLGDRQATPGAAQASTAVAPLVTLTSVSTVLKKRQIIQLNVIFSGPLNASQANSLATYRVASAGKTGLFTGKGSQVLRLKSALYHAATGTVALALKKPLALSSSLQVIVYGQAPAGLDDALGRLIDGDANGQPGGNATAVISKGHPTIAAVSYRPAIAKVRRP